MLDLFGVEMSLGSVNQLRQEASAAVAEAVAAVGEYVQHQPVVGMDETSFKATVMATTRSTLKAGSGYW